MTMQQVDYMNARRDAKPASGGTNYAVREHTRTADTARQRDAALNDGERSAEVLNGRGPIAALEGELAAEPSQFDGRAVSRRQK